MVKLTKIYTRTGDDGTTGLGTGDRVSKNDLRVDAYGEVDEANASIGLAISACARAGGAGVTLAEQLLAVQQDLFDLGADLCIPLTGGEKPGTKLRIQPQQTQRLELLIDQHNERLPKLNSFILPGGTEMAAALHMARTVVRRAERRVVALRKEDTSGTTEEPLRYLNRLSDLLFVLARIANDNGEKDVLWVPGTNRAE